MIIKICGITRLADALHAVQHGASALGFVFWPGSPRSIDAVRARRIVAALPPGTITVGVFVNQPATEIREILAHSGIGIAQLHGDESPEMATSLDVPVWKALPVSGDTDAWPDAVTILLDAGDPVRRGGTGRTLDWGMAARVARRRPLILAGGLTAANVAAAVNAVRPHGIDVSSGVESAPGVKDPQRVAGFLAAAQAGMHAAR